jgi:hypothetical protein
VLLHHAQKLSEVSFTPESKASTATAAKSAKAHVPNPRFLAAMRSKQAKQQKNAVVLGVDKQKSITTQLQHDHETDKHWGIHGGKADGDKTEARVLAKELYQVCACMCLFAFVIQACCVCVHATIFFS